jgi:CBS domain-containing protein
MQAKDIMSTPVITVGPQTPVHEVAALLVKQGISGVPVLDEGRLVGIVSEADLMYRHEIGTERDPATDAWWVRLFGVDRSPSRYVRSHATKSEDIMTRKVVSVVESTPLTEIAALFMSRRVRRVPVVRAGTVVGIISRANLVRALATQQQSPCGEQPESDDAIRSKLLVELESQPWWRSDWSSVTVSNGVVRFVGLIDSQDERDAARVAAENVPGVRRVEDRRRRYSDLPSSL